jgi:hypothetical protein
LALWRFRRSMISTPPTSSPRAVAAAAADGPSAHNQEAPVPPLGGTGASVDQGACGSSVPTILRRFELAPPQTLLPVAAADGGGEGGDAREQQHEPCDAVVGSDVGHGSSLLKLPGCGRLLPVAAADGGGGCDRGGEQECQPGEASVGGDTGHALPLLSEDCSVRSNARSIGPGSLRLIWAAKAARGLGADERAA